MLEIDGFEAEFGPDRGGGALSRARNRICPGNHRQIRHREPRKAAWGPTSGIGAVNVAARLRPRAAGGAQGGLVGHLDRVVEDEDAGMRQIGLAASTGRDAKDAALVPPLCPVLWRVHLGAAHGGDLGSHLDETGRAALLIPRGRGGCRAGIPSWVRRAATTLFVWTSVGGLMRGVTSGACMGGSHRDTAARSDVARVCRWKGKDDRVDLSA